MNLENSIIEKSQTQKATYCMILFIRNVQNRQTLRDRKTSISALLTLPKPSAGWTTTNSGKFLKRWEYQTT